MVARRSTSRALIWLCALAGCLALVAAPAFSPAAAQAELSHHLISQIKEIPATGPKGEPVPVAGPIRQSAFATVDSGHLWTVEREEFTFKFRIDEFDASTGAFMAQLAYPEGWSYTEDGIAVGHSTGENELYVGTDTYPESPYSPRGSVGVFGPEGKLQNTWIGTDTPASSFGCFNCGTSGDIAVDNSKDIEDWAAGDVYVADPELSVLDVFKPEAGGKEKYVTQITGNSATEPFGYGTPAGVAVNETNGDVLVLTRKGVSVFKPALLDQYEFVREITAPPGGSFGEGPERIAVGGGEANGDIYVATCCEIDQFNAKGEYLGHLPNIGARALAVDPESEDLYVGVYGAIDVFGPSVVIPDVATKPASGFKPSGHGQVEATLNGTVNADKAGPATCVFEWGTTPSLGQEAPCTSSVEGEAPVPVSVNLIELEPDATYYYALRATNANGTQAGTPAQVVEFTTPGPGFHGDTVESARAESLTFVARINPNNLPTTYYFQYEPASEFKGEYTRSVPAAPGASIEVGDADVEVSQHIDGLTPATTYDYRVAATSELSVEVSPGKFETETATFYSPNQTFTTQTVGLPFHLPDGRVWEMVSPPQKEGATFANDGSEALLQAASNGDAFTDFTLFVPTEANPAGSNWLPSTLFARGPNGWTSTVIAPPHPRAGSTPAGNGIEYWFFSEDLSKAVLQPFDDIGPLSPEASETTPYVRTNFMNGEPANFCTRQSEETLGVHCYNPIVHGCPKIGTECAKAVEENADVPAGTEFGGTNKGRCEFDFCGPEFDGATPDLSHVVFNSRVSLMPGTEGGLYEWSAGKLTYVGSGQFGGNGVQVHAVSTDGSRVIFTEGSPFYPAADQLLMRDTVTGQVLKLNGVRGPGSGEGYTVLDAASADDSRVFFTEGNYREGELLECKVVEEAGKLKCDYTVIAQQVLPGVPDLSEDGSYLYFISHEALAPGATPGGQNIYVRHDGEKPAFIATLSEEDSTDWCGPACLTDRVSPDGRYLEFMSSRDLTGYDSTDAVMKIPDQEVYLYHASEHPKTEPGHLICASCNPTGARPVGTTPSHLESSIIAPRSLNGGIAADVPPWIRHEDGVLYQPRYLSNSGRLFFNSHDALVPQDVDGTMDPYEYEPAGVSDCSTASITYNPKSGGCVNLISSGTSTSESGFLDASETGGDVFFLTTSQLVPKDFDDAYDVYDAHECTQASRCFLPPPPSPPPCDNGEACKPAQTPQPAIFGEPASATFRGAGNPSFAPPAKQPTELTRAQKLAKALKACTKRPKSARAACRRAAERRFGKLAAKKKTAVKRKRRSRK